MKLVPAAPVRAFAFAAWLLWVAPRAARAEDALSYKYEDYRERAGRIAVKTQGAYAEKDLGPDLHLKISGLLDAIAGATPNGQPVPVGTDAAAWYAPHGGGAAELHERRKAWNADLSRQFARFNLTLGVGNSRESDYVSTGWSLNTLTDFHQKNTTLLLGVAGTDDDVKVFYQPARAKKRTNDLIVGVTQLLSPRASVTLNLTGGRQTGYLSDPYKLVEKSTEIIPGVSLPLTFPENRPDQRDKAIALLGLNRAFPEAHGTLDASYRFYRDSFDVTAHTLEVAWFQRLGDRVLLRPALRLYEQTAAEFYHYRLDGTAIVPLPGRPRPGGPFYSSDWRLSAMQSSTCGVKLIWKVTAALHIDAAFERYNTRGTDHVTPQAAYSRADIVTGGVKFSW